MLNDLLFLAAPIERWISQGPPAAKAVVEAWPYLLVFAVIVTLLVIAVLRACWERKQMPYVQYDVGDRPRETLEIRARRAGE